MQKDKDGLEEVHNFLERHSPNYFLIILDVRTCDVWINDGAANYGLIVILHWTGSTFMLLSTTYTTWVKIP